MTNGTPACMSSTTSWAIKFAELTAPHGGVDCCKIVGVDWRDKDQVRRFRDPADGRREVCSALVGEMAAYLRRACWKAITPPH